MIIPIIVGLLFGVSIYLILQRGMVRIAFGFVMLTNAINLFLMTTGGTFNRDAPFTNGKKTEGLADPLPQSFVLTAIVISFAITVFLLTLSAISPNDDTYEDQSPEVQSGSSKAENEN